MAFFYDDATCLEGQRRNLLTIPRIKKRLETFDHHRHRRGGGGGGNDDEIDYSDLAAQISILDISLDICIPRSNNNSNNNSSRRKSNQEEEEKEEEVLFNNDVDNLAQLLRSMFTNISDSGASHITRTAAKEVLNQVYHRVIYALRTKPRSKRNLFHDDYSVDVVIGTNRHHGTRTLPNGGPDGGGGGDGNKFHGPLMRYFPKQSAMSEREK